MCSVIDFTYMSFRITLDIWTFFRYKEEFALLDVFTSNVVSFSMLCDLMYFSLSVNLSRIPKFWLLLKLLANQKMIWKGG